MTTQTAGDMRALAARARTAARVIARRSNDERNAVLAAMADAIDAAAAPILAANEKDMTAGRAAGLSAALLDRLRLDADRIAAMSGGLRSVATLPDPVGRVLGETTGPGGLLLQRVSVPLGVIAMIYESRPNVTADAAGLCVKAGNSVILRGGSEAIRSNRAVHDALVAGGRRVGLPDDVVQMVTTTDRAAVHELLKCADLIDLVIPRGGESLIRAVAEHSRVPVLKHYKGVCHVYVDRVADWDMATAIAVNAKCQRPGVCNAMETLLVHAAVAPAFLPRVAAALRSQGVELRGDRTTCDLIEGVSPATDADWSTEYLDLVLTVGVVADLDAAIDHIERYGTRHSDVIVTDDPEAADRFVREVDSAAVYVNASSRFTDGGCFGLGAEIGISTDKLHARGPCGVEALTTYKWIGRGTGQVRGE